MLSLKKTVIVVFVAELVFLASVMAWIFAAESFDDHRSPILIDGNASFTRENGVTRGEGTIDNPYLIEGWKIDASRQNGVEILNTDAHFVIRDVSVADGQLPGHWEVAGFASAWGAGCGIRLFNVTNGVVEDCILTNNQYGISVVNSSDVVLRENVISEGGAPNVEMGVYLSNSLRIELEGNALDSNGLTIAGTMLEHFNSHSASSSNTVNGHPMMFVKNEVGLSIEGGEIGQLIAVNCSGLSVTGVSISNTEVGLFLAFCDNFTVLDSEIAYCSIGNMRVWNSSDGRVSGCRISESVSNSGLDIRYSRQILIENCKMWDNKWDAVNLWECDGISVTNNRMWGDESGLYARESLHLKAAMNNISVQRVGILLVSCNDSDIIDNTVSSSYEGLDFSYWTCNVTITYNTIFACPTAIELAGEARDLTFHHNNIIENIMDVSCTGNASARWNDSYPDGGNYWSNHSGNDSLMGPDQDLVGQDGIADTPYFVTENSTDAYPLMAPTGEHASKPIPRIEFDREHIYPNNYFTASALESWDYSDNPEQLWVRWDWGDNGTWDTQWTTEMTTDHVLYPSSDPSVLVQVRDSEGNIGELLTKVPFDGDPPYAVVKADAKPRLTDPSSYDGQSVNIWWGILDTGVGIDRDYTEWFLDGVNIEMGGFSYSSFWGSSQYEEGGIISFYDLSSGSHVFKVVSCDFSGNPVEAEVSFTIVPGFMQTKTGVAIVSVGYAAFLGIVTVVVVNALVKRQGRQRLEPPSEGDQEPPAGEWK